MRTPEQIAALKAEMNSIRWWHHIDLGPELGFTPGTEPAPRSRDSYMRIDWSAIKGKTVLDIGAWDGLYSFEAEKAGAADVTAVDLWSEKGSWSYTGLKSNRAGFDFAKKVLKSNVAAWEGSVYDFDEPITLSFADVVFFFGVLYHLQDPMRGLRGCFSILKPGGLLIVETALDENTINTGTYMRFCEGSQDGDPTNWIYPNIPCVLAMLRSCGFVNVEYTGGIGSRGAFHARKP